ncbi:MAG TPA: transglycosylase SLT domain-containing protein [Terriglobales bacterium]
MGSSSQVDIRFNLDLQSAQQKIDQLKKDFVKAVEDINHGVAGAGDQFLKQLDSASKDLIQSSTRAGRQVESQLRTLAREADTINKSTLDQLKVRQRLEEENFKTLGANVRQMEQLAKYQKQIREETEKTVQARKTAGASMGGLLFRGGRDIFEGRMAYGLMDLGRAGLQRSGLAAAWERGGLSGILGRGPAAAPAPSPVASVVGAAAAGMAAPAAGAAAEAAAGVGAGVVAGESVAAAGGLAAVGAAAKGALASISATTLATGALGVGIVGLEVAGFKAAKSMGEYALRIREVQATTGMSVEQVQKLDIVARMSGRSLDDIQRGMRGFTQALEGGGASAEKARKELEAIGVDVVGLINGTADVYTAFQKIGEALKKNPEYLKTNIAMMDVLKRGGLTDIEMFKKIADIEKITSGIPIFDKDQLAEMDDMREKAEKMDIVFESIWNHLKYLTGEIFVITVKVASNIDKLTDAAVAKVQDFLGLGVTPMPELVLATPPEEVERRKKEAGFAAHLKEIGQGKDNLEGAQQHLAELKKKLTEMHADTLKNKADWVKDSAAYLQTEKDTNDALAQQEVLVKKLTKAKSDQAAIDETLAKGEIEVPLEVGHPFETPYERRYREFMSHKPKPEEEAKFKKTYGPEKEMYETQRADEMQRATAEVMQELAHQEAAMLASHVQPTEIRELGHLGVTKEDVQTDIQRRADQRTKIAQDAFESTMDEIGNRPIAPGDVKSQNAQNDAIIKAMGELRIKLRDIGLGKLDDQTKLNKDAEKQEQEHVIQISKIQLSDQEDQIKYQAQLEERKAQLRTKGESPAAGIHASLDIQIKAAHELYDLKVKQIDLEEKGWQNELDHALAKHELDKELYRAQEESQLKLAEMQNQQIDTLKGKIEPLYNTLFTDPSKFGKQMTKTLQEAAIHPLVSGLSDLTAHALHPLMYGATGEGGLAGITGSFFHTGGNTLDKFLTPAGLRTTAEITNWPEGFGMTRAPWAGGGKAAAAAAEEPAAVQTIGGASREMEEPEDQFAGAFAKASQATGVTQPLLRAVAQVESSMRAGAVSPKGAMGLMQLMPATLKDWGVTQPLSPEQNVMGGAEQLHRLLVHYHGNVQSALSAYNMGQKAYDTAMSKGQELPQKTQDYVQKVFKASAALGAPTPTAAGMRLTWQPGMGPGTWALPPEPGGGLRLSWQPSPRPATAPPIYGPRQPPPEAPAAPPVEAPSEAYQIPAQFPRTVYDTDMGGGPGAGVSAGEGPEVTSGYGATGYGASRPPGPSQVPQLVSALSGTLLKGFFGKGAGGGAQFAPGVPSVGGADITPPSGLSAWASQLKTSFGIGTEQWTNAGLLGKAGSILSSQAGAQVEMGVGMPLAMAGITGQLRGTGGGIAETAGGGALVGAGIGTMIMPGLGTAIGAGIGAVAGAGIGLGEMLAGVESPRHEAIRLVKQIYHIGINNATADSIVNIANQSYGGRVGVAVRSPEVRHMLGLYAAGTGQANQFQPGLNEPHGASLVESGGTLYQQATYQYGNAYTYASSLPVYGNTPGQPTHNLGAPGGGGNLSLSLNVGGASAAAFMTGQVVTPDVVQQQYASAMYGSTGRVGQALMLSQPGSIAG